MEPRKPASIGDLEPGVVYIVTQAFTDYHGQKFEVGRTLTFEGRWYFAYHGGHTISFRETLIGLQEDDQDAILGSLADYLAVHDESGRRPAVVEKGSSNWPEASVKSFLGGLFMVAMCAAALVVDKRNWVWAGLGVAFFGAITFMEGRALWDSHRGSK